MNLGDTRRTFLSSLLLAGGSAAAFGESFKYEPDGRENKGDALFEHIQRQLTEMVRNARARGGLVSAEEAAAGAAYMRICAVHARGLQLDRVASQALDRRIALVGRNSLLDSVPDAATLGRSLQRRGLLVNERLVQDVVRADAAAREAALQAIQRGRTSTACDGLADALETAAQHITRRGVGVQRVSTADESWCLFVIQQWGMYLSLAWYIASFQDPGLAAFLEGLWAGVSLYDSIYTAQC
jgi:hypothetical protein